MLEHVDCINMIKLISSYSTYKNEIIVVIGQSEVSKNKLLVVAKSLRIEKIDLKCILMMQKDSGMEKYNENQNIF